MKRTADDLVLGAGMVGVSTALALQSRGREVVLVDRLPAGEATSFGNAGIIQAEAVVPYMLPLEPVRLTEMLLNRRSEAHVHYSALMRLAPWLIRYLWNSRRQGEAAGAAAHLPLIRRCLFEHDALIAEAGAESLLRRTGYLKLFRSERRFEKELAQQRKLKADCGIRFEVLGADGIQGCEPHLSSDAAGGFLFTDTASVSDPSALVKAYAELFRARGGRFETADASTLRYQGSRWTIDTAPGPLACHEAVVAMGPWSGDLLAAQGVRLPFAFKRGYHMHYKAVGNATLERPVLDSEMGFVLSPMARGIRLTTGAEFALRDAPVTPRQLAILEPVARRLFPLENRLDEVPWVGARPCLPDMTPVIGPVPGHPGLWCNFGHHHLGLTLGPVTGRLIAEMMTGEEPFTNPRPYRLDRF